MLNRNTLIFLAALTVGILILLVSQPGTSKPAAAQGNSTAASTAASTEVDAGAACEALRTVAATPAPTAAPGATQQAVEVARPSNPGGPGPALKLAGDPKSGEKIYTDNCQKCHGDQGQVGVQNPGSDDGTVPVLNPIDSSLVDVDALVYACNLDLFVEHGSVPSGPSPQQTMPAWGDDNK